MLNRIKRSIAFRIKNFLNRPKISTLKITKKDLDLLSYKPKISVIVPVYNIQKKYLTLCIESVRKQSYPNWELCLFDDCSTLKETIFTLKKYEGKDERIKIKYSDKNLNISNAMNQSASLATGEFLSFLDNDDELHENALYYVAKELNKNRDIDYFYTDEDKIEMNGRHSESYYKPDYSPELLHTVMYFLHLITIRKSLFQKLGGFRDQYAGAQDYDLALRVTRETERIVHIPEILYHWRKIPGSAAAKVDAKPQALINAKGALEEHIRILSNENAYVEDGLLHGTFRVRYKVSKKAKVTILIPTNNGTRDIPGRGNICLVENLIKSIIAKTKHIDYSILVVDNANSSEELKEYYRKNNVQLVEYKYDPKKEFNFAEKANFCFSKVDSEYVLFLNDDMEVRDSEWLLALMEPLQNPKVGIVGAKLIYPNESIQHAGIVLHKISLAMHIFHSLPKGAYGDYGFSHMIKNYSAVTGACMLFRNQLLKDLKGFDLSLGIDFNDIDFCLRAVEKGYRVVYTPFCEIFHFEQSTLKRFDQKLEEKKAFIERWQKKIDFDPYYNKNLP